MFASTPRIGRTPNWSWKELSIFRISIEYDRISIELQIMLEVDISNFGISIYYNWFGQINPNSSND